MSIHLNSALLALCAIVAFIYMIKIFLIEAKTVSLTHNDSPLSIPSKIEKYIYLNLELPISFASAGN